MKSYSRSIRFFVFSAILAIVLSGVYTVPAFTSPVETVEAEITNANICPECYIVYVWIEHVRWAQVYNSEGNMIDFYADPES
ncbi:MAG: hypothetical protein IAE90_02645 [Ignavibacteria bacterium]|nr:hypothetical protein [Ignavibacteria bacterium]